MDAVARYQFLRSLDETYEPRLRGKILQRLLQLAFLRAGFRLVEERISEGIDFDVAHPSDPARRYSIEARTTAGLSVPVKTEDLRQMEAREQEGYRTAIAALRLAPGSRWTFAGHDWLAPPSLRVSIGNTAGWEETAAEINRCFDAVLDEYAAAALEEGLAALEPDF